MPQCAVATCRNSHRRTRGRRIRYHRFPQIPEVRSRWVRACGRVPLSNGEIPFNIQTARICSLHFNNESYEKDIEHLVLGLPARSRLRRGAVPTLGVPVNVQPVTKMLVEDAKRSLLKVAHAKIITDRKISNGSADERAAATLDDAKSPPGDSNGKRNVEHARGRNVEGDEQQRNVPSPAESSTRYLYNHQHQSHQRQQSQQRQSQQRNKSAIDNPDYQKMADIDVLLALGLKPAPRLNKMHAAVEYGSSGISGKKVEANEKREEDARGSPKVPQSRQNGAALPEETATAMATSGTTAERLCPAVKHENFSDAENEQQSMPIDCARPRRRSVDEVAAAAASRNSSKSKSNTVAVRIPKSEREHTRKRRSTDDSFSSNCNPFTKKICFEQRERFIDSLVGTSERVTAEELASRADELRAEVQALDEMARAKEMEWNEILSMRKLKEEAYLRIERRRQVVGFMESNGQLSENLPPASLSLIPDWEAAPRGNTGRAALTIESASGREAKDSEEVRLIETQECQRLDDNCRNLSPAPPRREKTSISLKSSNHAQRRTASPKQVGENGRKQQQRHQQHQQQQQQQHHHQHLQQVDSQSLDNRQIGEGRQGPIVDVRSIIADYRLRHPETVPRRYDIDSPARPRDVVNTTSGLINVRRGRRMRNSVNIGLGAGGAMVETGHNVDSRPSSTDSCKSNPNPSGDPNNSMSFKDVLVQYAKFSQQQGEPVKTPQNYPDVTLHPVAPSPIIQNTAAPQQTTGSLLHGILTKSQSPRPATLSPTLARLLTAPERERNSAPPATNTPQQNAQTQHLLQTYQGSNPVSISDLLSSSKARTEITITPVVNPVAPIHTSHSNNLIHVDDVEEDTSLIDERDSRITSGARDNRDERDSPPRCQGCQECAAQFVCAGCGNQWYCSRDCQVAAWDEHSEVCSG